MKYTVYGFKYTKIKFKLKWVQQSAKYYVYLCFINKMKIGPENNIYYLFINRCS